jgi:hypothetical protein
VGLPSDAGPQAFVENREACDLEGIRTVHAITRAMSKEDGCLLLVATKVENALSSRPFAERIYAAIWTNHKRNGPMVWPGPGYYPRQKIASEEKWDAANPG